MKPWKSIVVYGDGKLSQPHIPTGAEKQALIVSNRLKQQLLKNFPVVQYFQRVYPSSTWRRWLAKAVAKGYLKTVVHCNKPQYRIALSYFFLHISKKLGCFESPAQSRQNSICDALGEPCIVIGASSSVAPFLVATKYRYKSCKTVQVMHPRCNTDLFDAVISPKHDIFYQKYNKGNWIPTTLSLHELSPEYLKRTREITICQYPFLASVVKFVILIGGPRHRWQNIYYYSYPPYKSIVRFVDSLWQALNKISPQNYLLLVTVSNRTPPRVGQFLYQQLEKHFGKDRLWFYDPKQQQDSFNPYHQYLSVADYILVTSESVNMISEALSCKRPVYVYDLFDAESSLFSSRRLRLFLDNLMECGWIIPFQGIFHIPYSLEHNKEMQEKEEEKAKKEDEFVISSLLRHLGEIP